MEQTGYVSGPASNAAPGSMPGSANNGREAITLTMLVGIVDQLQAAVDDLTRAAQELKYGIQPVQPTVSRDPAEVAPTGVDRIDGAGLALHREIQRIGMVTQELRNRA